MKIGKLKYLLLIVLILVLLVSCSKNENQLVTKNIDVVVAWKEGTVEDKLGSKLTELLDDKLKSEGQNIEVTKINISGLSGSLATQEFLSSEEDTRKILINNEAIAFYKALALSDYGIEDIEVLKMLTSDKDVLIARNDDRFQTLESLLIQIKENPNRIDMGYSGVGTNSDVYMRVLENAGYKVGKKAYESQVDVIEAVNNNEVDFAVVGLSLVDDYLDLETSNISVIGSFSNDDVGIEGAEKITARVESMGNYISKYNPIFIALDQVGDEKDSKYLKDILVEIFESEEWKTFVTSENLEDISNLNQEEIDEYWMNYMNNRIDIISQ